MALSVDGARKLIDVAKRSKVVLGVNFALRQHPGLQELKQEISSRGLGDIIQIYVHLSRKSYQGEGWWRDQFHSGPMCLMDLGVQGLDLLMWLSGRPALEVSAIGIGGRDDQTLNVAVAVAVNFSSGAQGIVSANNTANRAENFIMVQGSDKQVVAEMSWPDGDGSLKLRRFQAGKEEEKRYDPLDLYQVSAQNFNNAVLGFGKYSPCCEETYPVVESCCAAIESLQNGRTIRAGEIQRVSGARF
jgi:predicted dehydrogenase